LRTGTGDDEAMAEHDLVIGGSGMLAGLVEAIARQGRRLERLAKRHPNIHPLQLDYTHDAALDAGLARAVQAHGPLRRCVAWMHDDSKDRALRIARQVGEVYCEVLGSASADPARPEGLAEWQTLFAPLSQPKLRLAVLGFTVEGGGSRWLYDDEISAGALQALGSENPVTIVGTVTPWDARP